MKTATHVKPGMGKSPPEKAGRSPPAPRERILLMAPTGHDAKLTSGFLNRAGFAVEVCWDMAQVCRKMEEGCGAVVLAEETLGPESLPSLQDALNTQPSWSDIPITIITDGGE